MKLALIFLAAFTCHTLEALLPPFYQDKKEIEEILSSPKFKKYAGEDILSITKEGSSCVIETTKHTFFIKVVRKDSKDQNPGPAEFSLHFQPPVEKNDED